MPGVQGTLLRTKVAREVTEMNVSDTIQPDIAGEIGSGMSHDIEVVKVKAFVTKLKLQKIMIEYIWWELLMIALKEEVEMETNMLK